jgi:hypothetical protein
VVLFARGAGERFNDRAAFSHRLAIVVRAVIAAKGTTLWGKSPSALPACRRDRIVSDTRPLLQHRRS